MQSLVKKNKAPGLVAYADAKPVGWCAVAPREQFVRFENSRVLKPVDDQPVWSVSCFFVAKKYRRLGVTVALLKAAADYAREHGASILEGYPTDTSHHQPTPSFIPGWLLHSVARASKEVARRSTTRPIMRRALQPVRK